MNPTPLVPFLFLAALGTAQQQFDAAGKRHLPADFPQAPGASALAMDDVDGDGDLDVVIASSSSLEQCRLYRNEGGHYVDATALGMPPAGAIISAVALGDVDGDRHLDIVGGALGPTLLYLGDGSGGFADATAGRMPGIALVVSCVALADLDGDDDLDVVLGCSNNPRQTRLFVNDGAGTFTDATAGRMPADNSRTTCIAVGDVDRDGDFDLVLGAGDGVGLSAQTRLYLNDGTGTFADATALRLPADAESTMSIALVDVDGDGDPDIVVGNRGTNRLYRNDGTGAFADATAGNLQGQGNLESVVDISAGDVDGDGDLDLLLGLTGLAAAPAPRDRICINDGSGRFTLAAPAPITAGGFRTAAARLRDVDGDGDVDALLLRHGGQLRNELWFNDGAGGFVNGSAIGLVPFAGESHLALADVDGDGDLDLCAGTRQEQDRLFVNDGRGSFAEATATRMPATVTWTMATAAGDLDGDGAPELVLATLDLGARLYHNDGHGVFADATAARLPAGAAPVRCLALGDVDGDRDLDIVLGSNSAISLQTRLFLNDGQGRFASALQALPVDGDRTVVVLLADIDGDGDLDLLLGNFFDPSRAYVNDGSGRFADETATRLGALTGSIGACGDVDGDGDVDVVLADGSGAQLLVNDGRGNFAAAAGSIPPIPASYGLALADVDEDGDLDLAIGDAGTSGTLCTNDGTGRFVASDRLPPVPWAEAVFGDVDGDRDLDLAVALASSTRAGNQMFKNLRRQLTAPHVARIGAPYTLEASARHGPFHWADVAFPFVSPAPASVHLEPFGTIGIDLAGAVPLPQMLIPQPAGVASTSFVVPANPALVGITVYAQMLLAQLPGDYWLSNVTADRIGR